MHLHVTHRLATRVFILGALLAFALSLVAVGSAQARSSRAKPKHGQHCRPTRKHHCPKKHKTKKGHTTLPVQTLPAPGNNSPGQPSGQAPPAPSGPTTGQAAIDQFTRALIGSKLDYYHQSSDASSSTTETLRFCTNTFTDHVESISGGSYGSYSSANTFHGTWKVNDAVISADQSQAQGHVAYTSDDPDDSSGVYTVTLIGSNRATIGRREYGRSGGGGGC